LGSSVEVLVRRASSSHIPTPPSTTLQRAHTNRPTCCLLLLTTSLCSASRVAAMLPKQHVICAGHASHEVLHPSSDIPVEVRITRDYLSRHLPPLGFLNPSTNFSFNGVPALFHAGATYGVQRTGADSPGNVRVRCRYHPEGRSPLERGTLERRKQPKSFTTEQSEACNDGTLSRPSFYSCDMRRCVTHLRPCKQSPWEEGAATSRSSSSPTVTRKRNDVTVASVRPAFETRRYNRVRKPNCRTTPVTPAFAT